MELNPRERHALSWQGRWGGDRHRRCRPAPLALPSSIVQAPPKEHQRWI